MCKIVYVCDIDEDIDDMIAVEYLHQTGNLDYVVLDKPSISSRINDLKQMGIQFNDNILNNTHVVFCGGAFTKIAEYIQTNTLDVLVANGGFVGNNIVKSPLAKFDNKKMVRTYNLNLDVAAALAVFNTTAISVIRLVTKNVCHSHLNTYGKIHNDEFLKKYNLRDGKRLHDLLMVKEGISLLNNSIGLCEYANVIPIVKEDRKHSIWGSELDFNSHIETTINFINNIS